MTLSSPASEPRTPSLPRPTALQVTLVALLMFSAMINYVDRQATAVVSTDLMRDLHLDKVEWGWVNAAFSAAYVLSSWLGGIWIDRVGVRKGLTVSTIVWSLAAVGHAFAGGFASLVGWRMLLAVGEGPGGACQLKGVRRVLPPHLRDVGTGIVGSGTLLGAILAPLLIAPLAGHYGWKAAFAVTGAVGMLWLPFWWLSARSPKANLSPVQEVPDTEQATTAVVPKEAVNFRSWGVWAVLLGILFTIPATVFTLSFFPDYLKETYGLKVMEQARYQWMPFAAMDVGQVLGGFSVLALLRRGASFLGARRGVLILGIVGSTLILGMLGATTLAGAMIALVAGRFFFQYGYTALLSYGISAVPERQAAQMNGVMNATFGLCGFIFNPLIGYLAKTWGYGPVIVLVGLCPLLGLACWLFCSAQHARLQST